VIKKRAVNRELAIAEREELVRLREARLEARAEAEAGRASREHLIVQIREANENLVAASLQAQQLADEAMAARAAADEFIGILGHDLRNPLTSIIGGVEMLRELPAPFARTVSRLGRSADRIHVIIRDVLDFARGRLGGGIPIRARACDMADVCNEVIDEIRQAHATRRICFEGHGDISGIWDTDRLEQVISNLVGNAIVHGLDPIVVMSRGEESHVITTVNNRGAPIPDALLSILFEPFSRGENFVEEGHLRADDGLGLGLYIAHEIVHAHGGTLRVSSSADEGTSFTFALPRVAPRRP
jgi:signal transduction histidine kinase